MYCENIKELFKDWDEGIIWSCLQGYMGTIIADDEENPKSAIINNGDFSFCAGIPSQKLLKKIPKSNFRLITSSSDDWHALIKITFGKKAKKVLRYAIKKEPYIFDKEKLKTFVGSLDNKYEIKLFDEEIFKLAQNEDWSNDLCSQFKNYKEYQKYAIGVAILFDGKIVSGASPYGVYKNGVEIEIDTKPEFRGKGLATVCGAKLILECLSRNIYPSWDAHDLRSVHLAEKLGYHLSHPYVTYEITNTAK